MNKFILEEQKRYLLSERLVLTEAGALLSYDQFKAGCDSIAGFIKAQLEVVENDTDNTAEKEQIVSKILSETDQLILDTDNVNDANIIRGHIDKYFDRINNFLLVLDPNYTADTSTQLRKTVNELKAKTNDTDSSHKAAKALRNSIKDLHALFTRFVDDLTTEEKSGDETKFDRVDQEIILNNIYEDILKLSKYTKANYDKTPFKILFSKSIEALNNVAKSDTLFEFIKLSKTLHDGDFGKTIRTDTTVTLDQSEIDSDRAGRINWAVQYQQAGDKDKFWDDYYRTVWGSNAEKVRALGDAVKQECIVLGFTRESNPFLAFIEDYIIGKSFPVTKSQYNAIHDTIANNGAISTIDLIKPILPLKGGNMILWYKDFYVKASTYEAVREYLKVLGQLRYLDYANLIAVDVSTMEPAAGAAYSNFIAHCGGAGGNMSTVIYNLFIEEVPTASLLKAGSGITCPDSPSDKGIRSASDIKKLLGVLKVDTSAKKAWTAESTSKLVAAIKENPSFSHNSASWAKKFLTMIATIYASADQVATLQKEPWWTLPKNNEPVVIKQELEKLGGGISMAQFAKLRKDFEAEGWLK